MNQIRVADYVANFLYDSLNIKEVFLVTGGGAMFLNDGIAKHEKIKSICNHHEQASAMGAVAYAKYKNSYAAVMTTSGCGATNAITGLLDAWQDSVPVFFISGQAKRKETVYNSGLKLRQLGVQEADIISIVESISKYSVIINDPNEIAFHLEKAAYLATSGRSGPIWLDIPQDVQGAIINLDNLIHFTPSDEDNDIDNFDLEFVEKELAKSKRPIIIAGNGVRLSSSIDLLKTFINKYQIPVVSSYLGIDLLETEDSLNIGRVGIKGDRAGNFAVQNSDLLIVLGCRLSVALTGFEYDLFARESKIVVVDIDKIEHQKNTVHIDKLIVGNVRNFLERISSKDEQSFDRTDWLSKCLHWKEKWSVSLIEYEKNDEKINKYTFVKYLSKYSKKDTTFVADAGSAYYVTAQTLKISEQQRYITSGAQADMGFTLPAAIGVSFAKEGEVVAITGDGSFQMNIQELQTIVQYQLPIKIFVLNNNGYLSIRTTQSKFFEGRLMGTEPKSGISFPCLEKISNAYGIKYISAKILSELDEALNQTMSHNEPIICEIFCPEFQEIIPTVSSLKRADGKMVSKPTEDMYPFLDRKEFIDEMIIKPVDE